MKMEDYNNNHSESGELSLMGEIDEEVCIEQALDGLPEDVARRSGAHIGYG